MPATKGFSGLQVPAPGCHDKLVFLWPDETLETQASEGGGGEYGVKQVLAWQDIGQDGLFFAGTNCV